MYQVVVIILIRGQILMTNLQDNLWKLERRIDNPIVGVKGFTLGILFIRH